MRWYASCLNWRVTIATFTGGGGNLNSPHHSIFSPLTVRHPFAVKHPFPSSGDMSSMRSIMSEYGTSTGTIMTAAHVSYTHNMNVHACACSAPHRLLNYNNFVSVVHNLTSIFQSFVSTKHVGTSTGKLPPSNTVTRGQ